MNKTQKIKDMVLYAPYLIPLAMKDPNYDNKVTKGIMYKMIPFRSSIEIEHSGSPTVIPEINSIMFKSKQHKWGFFTDDTLNEIKRKISNHYKILDYSFDTCSTRFLKRLDDISEDDHYRTGIENETRISIKNYSQLTGLYSALNDLKTYNALNPASGIHIHIDAHKLLKGNLRGPFMDMDRELKTNANKLRDCLLSKLDKVEKIFPKYTGDYNQRDVSINAKGNWVVIRTVFKSVEFRIAPCTFDYSTIVKWIIDCNQLIKECYKELRVKY